MAASGGPWISDEYPLRLLDICDDVRAHWVEIETLLEILERYPLKQLAEHLIRLYLVLEIYKYGQRVQLLLSESAKLGRAVLKRAEECKLPRPFSTVPGSQKKISEVLEQLKQTRDKVVAHRPLERAPSCSRSWSSA